MYMLIKITNCEMDVLQIIQYIVAGFINWSFVNEAIL